MRRFFFTHKSIFLFFIIVIYTLTVSAEIKVGVADWMVLKRQKPGAFTLAKHVCADGLELDMGGLGKRDSFDNKLRNDYEVQKFLKMADSTKIEIGAIAMSGFYGQNFGEKPTYRWLIEDCLNTMDKMNNVKVAFLPLGGCGKDWTTNQKKLKVIIKRLHEVGNMAAKRGKVIGIDTPLDAAGNLKLLKKINSKGIKIFYKWQTATENGYDICAEIKTLGKDNICAFHASNPDGVWLKNDTTIDLKAIRKVLTEIGWEGWMFVERSRDTTMVRNVKRNFGENVRYLKDVFAPVRFQLDDTTGFEEAYINTILNRSQKITDELNITGTSKGDNVKNILANHYFFLNKVYEENKDVKAKLYDHHFDFIANLNAVCTPAEVDMIKDLMTYNVRNVKYEAQLEMIPTLNIEEREYLMNLLNEAREYAIDAKGSKEKHALFKKYMGRYTIWLSQRGYDLKKERQNWGARVKAKGGKL
ncbi:MAG: DUF3826 domain-containing protein [Bacteroidaceae bacterium]|nr:DUF3826 domain-containing protein [Bacteroidaceae bacterium]